MDDLLDLDWGSKGSKAKQQQPMLTLAQQQQQQSNTSTSSATMSSYNFDALTRSMPASNSSITSRTHTPTLLSQQKQQEQSSSSKSSASFSDLVNFGSSSSITAKPLGATSMASAVAAASAASKINSSSNGSSDAHLWDFDALGSSTTSASQPPPIPARAPAAPASQRAPQMAKPNKDIFSFLDENEDATDAPQARKSAQPTSASKDPFDFDAFNDDLPSRTQTSAAVPNLSVQPESVNDDEDDFLGALGKPVQPKTSPSPNSNSVDRLRASSPSSRTADGGSSNSSRVPSPVDGGRKRYQDGSRQQQRDRSEEEDEHEGPEDVDRHEGQRRRGGPASSSRRAPPPPQQQQSRRDFASFEDEEKAVRERDEAILGGGGGRDSPAVNSRRRPREGKSSNGSSGNGDASSAAANAATAFAATASSLFANAESMAANLFGGNNAGGDGGPTNNAGELFGALGRRFGFGTPSGTASPSGRKTDTPTPQSRSPAGARRGEPGARPREPVERFRDGGEEGDDGVLPRHPDDSSRRRTDDDVLRGSEPSAPRVSRNRYGVPRQRVEEEEKPQRDAVPAAGTSLFRDEDDGEVERPEEADRQVPRSAARVPAASDRNGSGSPAPAPAASTRPLRRPNNTAAPVRVQRAEAPIQVPRNIVSDSARAISAASAAKQAGNEAFKRGNYAEAESHYTKALDSLEDGSLRRVVLLNNRAQARLKNGEAGPAMRDCDAVLAIIVPPTKASSSSSANNNIKIYRPREETPLPDELAAEVNLRDAWSKAVLRRAQACEMMERWLSAKSGWDALLQFEKEEGSKNGVGNMRSAKEGLGRCEDMIGGGKKKKAPATTTRRPTPSNAAARDGAGVARVRQEAAQQAAEEASKLALKDSVDASIVGWKTGKENNIRALLASVSDVVVWPEFGWKKIGMHEVITDVQVKKAYTRAIAKLHPDKLSSKKDITLEQRMVASAVFTVLNEAFTATQS
ncbi:auxilin-like clathrin-binding protein required for normal clathrin function [Tilletia horrida]|nr:auxilin-like clathrin-binding protein required for normal clathrin function [Tilletia horrida]